MGAGEGSGRGSRFAGTQMHLREIGWGAAPSRAFPFLADRNACIYQKDIKGHFGCVNAIEASRDERLLTSGGDDHRVLVWNVASVQTEEEPSPIAIMRQLHYSNIFSLAFSNKGDKLYSAGNDSSLIIHDLATRNMIHRFKADEAIYNVSTNPIDDTVVMTASEDGKVRLHDLRAMEEIIAIRTQGTMYCAQFNPRQANLISVCSGRDGLSIHDCRNLDKPCFRLGARADGRWNDGAKSVMYGQWSELGDAIFATRSRSSPVYFDLNTGKSIEFKDEGYVNSCTVKSCSFISHDLVMTGSDDWNIYIWKIPEDKNHGDVVEGAYKVLKGHRSIVNHARYSPLNRMLFSSGVEKIIKVWSEWDLSGYYHDPVRRSMLVRRRRPSDMRNDDSVEEDLDMLAFFDLLTTDGDDEGMTDVGDEEVTVSHLDEHESSEDGNPLERLRRAYDEDNMIFVVSSPEMSEAELLSGDSEDESSETEGSQNAQSNLTENGE